MILGVWEKTSGGRPRSAKIAGFVANLGCAPNEAALQAALGRCLAEDGHVGMGMNTSLLTYCDVQCWSSEHNMMESGLLVAQVCLLFESSLLLGPFVLCGRYFQAGREPRGEMETKTKVREHMRAASGETEDMRLHMSKKIQQCRTLNTWRLCSCCTYILRFFGEC